MHWQSGCTVCCAVGSRHARNDSQAGKEAEKGCRSRLGKPRQHRADADADKGQQVGGTAAVGVQLTGQRLPGRRVAFHTISHVAEDGVEHCLPAGLRRPRAPIVTQLARTSSMILFTTLYNDRSDPQDSVPLGEELNGLVFSGSPDKDEAIRLGLSGTGSHATAMDPETR